ncbi:MAG TPA: molybdopterin molybdotransferase MoeA, partial [Candidatus Melainabacteria bacterium]|nr:molybdopterin molybdotransferase MoeA [Candidatus Melainabacteria bacterium]
MMLSYEEALNKIDETVEKLPAVDNAITHILGHVLADSITATFDLPRFDNSAMDGYGVRGEDLLTITDGKPKELALIGVIEAGSQKAELKIEPGKAVKIFTGAKVPPSVDTVVMKEYCDDLDSAVRIKEKTEAGSNIRRAGEEFRKGDLVLPSGILVTPPVVGLIASFGHARFKVYEKPRITIIGTGDELVAPGGELSASQIYDSNSYALAAAIQALGLPRPIRFNIKDQEDQKETALKEALRQTDMII